jgi:sulfur transfer protein SufE
MYEALEALAKVVTGRDKDLSANRELFLSKVKASEGYKGILKEYIEYANNFRHAPKQGQEKPNVSVNECESFVYLTGLFIRLAIRA